MSVRRMLEGLKKWKIIFFQSSGYCIYIFFSIENEKKKKVKISFSLLDDAGFKDKRQILSSFQKSNKNYTERTYFVIDDGENFSLPNI